MPLAVLKSWTQRPSTYPIRSSLRRVFIGHAKYSFQNDLQGLCQLGHSQLADLLEQTLYTVLRSNFFISWVVMKKIKGLTETLQAIMLHLQTALSSKIHFWLHAFGKLYERNLLTMHHILVKAFFHSLVIYLIPSEFKYFTLAAYMPYPNTKFFPSFSIWMP